MDKFMNSNRNKQSGGSVKALIGKFSQNDSDETKKPPETGTNRSQISRNEDRNLSKNDWRSRTPDSRTLPFSRLSKTQDSLSKSKNDSVNSKTQAYERLSRTIDRKKNKQEVKEPRSISCDRAQEYKVQPYPGPRDFHRGRQRKADIQSFSNDRSLAKEGTSTLNGTVSRETKHDLPQRDEEQKGVINREPVVSNGMEHGNTTNPTLVNGAVQNSEVEDVPNKKPDDDCQEKDDPYNNTSSMTLNEKPVEKHSNRGHDSLSSTRKIDVKDNNIKSPVSTQENEKTPMKVAQPKPEEDDKTRSRAPQLQKTYKTLSYEDLHKVSSGRASGVRQVVDNLERAKSNISSAIRRQGTKGVGGGHMWRTNSENDLRFPDTPWSSHARSQSERTNADNKSLQNYPLRKSTSQSSFEGDNMSVTSLIDNRTSAQSFGSSGSRFSGYSRSSRHRRRDRSQNEPGRRSVSLDKASRDTSPWIGRRQSKETQFSFDDAEVSNEIDKILSPKGRENFSEDVGAPKREELVQPSHSDKDQDVATLKQSKEQNGQAQTSFKPIDADIPTNTQTMHSFKPSDSSSGKTRNLSSTLASPKPFPSPLSSPALQSPKDAGDIKPLARRQSIEDLLSPKPIDISKYLIDTTQKSISQPKQPLSAEDRVNQEPPSDTELQTGPCPESVTLNGRPPAPSPSVQPQDIFKEAKKPLEPKVLGFVPPLPSTPPPPPPNSLSQEQLTPKQAFFNSNPVQEPNRNRVPEQDDEAEELDNVFLPNTPTGQASAYQKPEGLVTAESRPLENHNGGSYGRENISVPKSRQEDDLHGHDEKGVDFIDGRSPHKVATMQPQTVPPQNYEQGSFRDSTLSHVRGYLCHKVFRHISKNLFKPWTEFMSSLFEDYPDWYIRWKEGDIKSESDTDAECIYTCLILWRDVHANLSDRVCLEKLKEVCAKFSASLPHGIRNIVAIHDETQKRHLAYLDDAKLSSLALEVGPNEWKILGRFLGYTSSALEQLECNYVTNVGGAIQQMLVDWRNRPDADVNQLVTGLIRSNRNDLLRFLKPIRY